LDVTDDPTMRMSKIWHGVKLDGVDMLVRITPEQIDEGFGIYAERGSLYDGPFPGVSIDAPRKPRSYKRPGIHIDCLPRHTVGAYLISDDAATGIVKVVQDYLKVKMKGRVIVVSDGYTPTETGPLKVINPLTDVAFVIAQWESIPKWLKQGDFRSFVGRTESFPIFVSPKDVPTQREKFLFPSTQHSGDFAKLRHYSGSYMRCKFLASEPRDINKEIITLDNSEVEGSWALLRLLDGVHVFQVQIPIVDSILNPPVADHLTSDHQRLLWLGMHSLVGGSHQLRKWVIDAEERIPSKFKLSKVIGGLPSKLLSLQDRIIVRVYGSPGSGKSTIARYVQTLSNWFVIDSEDCPAWPELLKNIAAGLSFSDAWIQYIEYYAEWIHPELEKHKHEKTLVLAHTPNETALITLPSVLIKLISFWDPNDIFMLRRYTLEKRIADEHQYDLWNTTTTQVNMTPMTLALWLSRL
jgi:hypothetical protein